MAHRAADWAFQFDNLARLFFEALDEFLFEQREGRPIGQYSYQERILNSTRTQPAWTSVEMAWDDASRVLRPLVEVMGKILEGLSNVLYELP
jgi:DNA polymerase-3 subunit epsilon/ATP-dependent DNA helicase DinG